MDIETPSLRIACADLNGQSRGKRLPSRHADRLEFEGHRAPLSMLSTDIFGGIQGLSSGNPDGQLRMTERGPVPMPWLTPSASLLPMWMFTDDGTASDICPRHALARVIARYTRRGWSIRVSADLGFMLVDDSGPGLRPAISPVTRRPISSSGPQDLAAIDGFSAYFDAVQSGAEAMELPLFAISAGATAGQYEMGFSPQSAMRLADDLWLAKSLIRGTARAQDLAATFMANPMEQAKGSALRLSISLHNKDSKNLFDNGLHAGSDLLHKAVAGCVSCMAGTTLVFAPHSNSFARLVPDAEAPTGAAWGYENRTAAIRIPAGDPATRRLEHRTAGADTNPYLVLAAILGGLLMGIEDDLTTPDPIIGNAFEQRILQFPMDWDGAIERFANSPRAARIFPKPLIDAFTQLKRREQKRLSKLDPHEELASFLETV
ncbi:MAG: glutamine synthetase family protein [Mangrovicoccus sp.]